MGITELRIRITRRDRLIPGIGLFEPQEIETLEAIDAKIAEFNRRHVDRLDDGNNVSESPKDKVVE